MSIIITKNGKQAQRIDKSAFEAEDSLQQYIFNNPESLPLYEIKEDIRLLILAREFDTQSGPIDAIGIDKEGEIYVIETKLYKNTDKRFVVAQVLDYGASLWRHSDYYSFQAAAEQSVKAAFDIDLNNKLQDFFGLSPEKVEQQLENVKTNLNTGNYRFVVLMDKLHDRLKDLVVFLNANTRFSIYAVEIEYFKFDEYEIVIPRLFGAETKKNVAVSSGSSNRRTWDEKSFWEHAVENLTERDLDAARKLYAYSREKADTITWGTGNLYGSFNPKFSKTGIRSPFTIYSGGNMQLNFEYIDEGEEGQNFRLRWADALAKKLGFPVTRKSRYSIIDPELWAPRIDEFISILDELLNEK